MSSWSPYPSAHTLGHKDLEHLLDGPVVVQEKVDGCVTPDTLILTADLVCKPAGDLKPWDRLVGFTDTVNSPRLMESFVTSAVPIVKACYRVETDRGTVISSDDHPWLSKSASHSRSKTQWCQTSDLIVGDSIVALPIWTPDHSRAGGYLAGLFDSKGSLTRYGNKYVLSLDQIAGPALDQAQDLLIAAGFKFSVAVQYRSTDRCKIGTIIVHGGSIEIMRLLGTYQPSRLLLTAKSAWAGLPTSHLPRAKVLSGETIGHRDVIGLSTSTGTYVAAGLLCHNSQFSFGRFNDVTPGAPRISYAPSHPGARTEGPWTGYVFEDAPGVLRCRSKKTELQVLAPEKMFAKAIETVAALDLHPGWTYRAEYLLKPKHGSLVYDRVPRGYLILFDVTTRLPEEYLDPVALSNEASRLGLEHVPVLYEGVITDLSFFRSLLNTTSVLGGQKIEGIVVKNYDSNGKVLMGKFVSEAFKEVHTREWKIGNPTQGDIVQILGARYHTSARWQKAVQHLQESGSLTSTPRDIGALVREVPEDIEREHQDEIKDALYAWAWPKVRRLVCAGLPEWYQDRLLMQQFEREHDSKLSESVPGNPDA